MKRKCFPMKRKCFPIFYISGAFLILQYVLSPKYTVAGLYSPFLFPLATTFLGIILPLMH